MGLVAKPLSGAVGLVSQTAKGIAATPDFIADKRGFQHKIVVEQVRPGRQTEGFRRLQVYSQHNVVDNFPWRTARRNRIKDRRSKIKNMFLGSTDTGHHGKNNS